MITATVGTCLFIVVVISSIVIARRRLPYETWHAVHLTAYAAIALGWFHQIPTGNELVVDHVAADYWRSLYVATLAVLVAFRFGAPIANAFRFGFRVEAVVAEGPGVVSLRIGGRRLERLQAQPGQFFIWRFLTRRDWWRAHPFSLSAAPGGSALRITVKELGDFTHRLGEIPVGTRVLAEGPLGVFTDAVRAREKVLLIAGGIGITPIRALLEEMEGDLVVVYRVLTEDDVIFRDELDVLAASRAFMLHVVVGDHATDEGRNLLSPEHLRALVPDIAEREVYLCGPPAMTVAIERNLRHTNVSRKHVHVERFAL
jgi:predicted ferric reductase